MTWTRARAYAASAVAHLGCGAYLRSDGLLSRDVKPTDCTNPSRVGGSTWLDELERRARIGALLKDRRGAAELRRARRSRNRAPPLPRHRRGPQGFRDRPRTRTRG